MMKCQNVIYICVFNIIIISYHIIMIILIYVNHEYTMSKMRFEM